ncbi:MAG: hypothetical protein ACLFT4_08015 [Bacteroidales bacterium]
MKKVGKRKMKKGQYKIQQMAFMMVGVAIFFIMVGLFWIILQRGDIQEKARELKEEKAVEISQGIMDSPEFTCSFSTGYCIDTDKVMVLQNMSTYDEYWPISSIKLAKFPAEEEIECDKDNYPNCTVFDVYRNENAYENKSINSVSSQSSYVALCRKERIDGYSSRVCELGRIIIGYEARYL